MSEALAGQEAPSVPVGSQIPAATPDAVAPAPGTTEAPEGEAIPQVPEKTLTQSEVNALIQKEKAKAEAKAERRALRAYRETLERIVPRQQQNQQQPQATRPERTKFATDDEWVEAVADWKIAERDATTRQERNREQERTIADKTEGLYAEAAKVEGFDRQEFDALPLTQAIAAAVTYSDIAPKLMAFMSQNPDEVARIANLPLARQAAEIGRLEGKILATPSAPKVSKAPAPIDPIGGNKGGTKDPAQMSQKEFNEWRRSTIRQR